MEVKLTAQNVHYLIASSWSTRPFVIKGVAGTLGLLSTSNPIHVTHTHLYSSVIIENASVACLFAKGGKGDFSDAGKGDFGGKDKGGKSYATLFIPTLVRGFERGIDSKLTMHKFCRSVQPLRMLDVSGIGKPVLLRCTWRAYFHGAQAESHRDHN